MVKVYGALKIEQTFGPVNANVMRLLEASKPTVIFYS